MATEHLHIPGETARLDHTERDLRYVHRVHVLETAIVAIALTIIGIVILAMFTL